MFDALHNHQMGLLACVVACSAAGMAAAKDDEQIVRFKLGPKLADKVKSVPADEVFRILVEFQDPVKESDLEGVPRRERGKRRTELVEQRTKGLYTFIAKLKEEGLAVTPAKGEFSEKPNAGSCTLFLKVKKGSLPKLKVWATKPENLTLKVELAPPINVYAPPGGNP